MTTSHTTTRVECPKCSQWFYVDGSGPGDRHVCPHPCGHEFAAKVVQDVESVAKVNAHYLARLLERINGDGAIDFHAFANADAKVAGWQARDLELNARAGVVEFTTVWRGATNTLHRAILLDELPQQANSAACCAVISEDTHRLEWLLPILNGEDDDEANRRTAMLGLALTQGLAGRAAIDKARGKS